MGQRPTSDKQEAAAADKMAVFPGTATAYFHGMIKSGRRSLFFILMLLGRAYYKLITKDLKYNFHSGETVIDTWSINYMAHSGSKSNGKLTVTNQRLLYKPVDEKNFLEIRKSEIASVQVQKSFFAKKAIITLLDGSKHIFNYGVLNIDKLVDAIRSS